jgi:succinate dehydrogenase/fumarate reductase flavoprotein subunit
LGAGSGRTLENLLALTAELVAHAKLARKESRSAHQRRDFPSMDDSWVKHVCLSRQEDGEVQVTLIPVATSG